LQERARFRRNYPPLTDSHDPHYHWRSEKHEDRHVDDILSRLIEVRVGPVEQAAPCACAAVKCPPPPRDNSCLSANNAVDTSLPYNPWYGSYTEHRLNAMSIDDVSHRVQIIRPVTTAIARWRVHVEEDWNIEEKLSTTEMGALSTCDETRLNDLVERNLSVRSTSSAELDKKEDSTAADGATEQASALQQAASAAEAVFIATSQCPEPVTPPQEPATTYNDVALNKDVLESTATVEKREKKVDNYSGATDESSENQPQSAGYPVSRPNYQVALTKTPEVGLLETTQKHEPDKVQLKPKNSASSDEVAEVSFVKTSSENQPEANSKPQQDTQTTTVAGELDRSNCQQDPNKQDDTPKNLRNLENNDGKKEFNHASTPAPQRKSRSLFNCLKGESSEPSEGVNSQQNESETKPEVAPLEHSANVASVPRPHTSLKKISSTPPLLTENEELDRTGETKEKLEQVETDKSNSSVEFSLRRTESRTDLGEVEEMEVDEADAEEHAAAEATDEDAEMKSERRSEEKLTNSTDKLDTNSDQHHNHQAQQQSSLEAQPEINTEQTKSKDMGPTTDPVTVADGLEISLPATAAVSIQEETSLHHHCHHYQQQQQQSESVKTSKKDQTTISASGTPAVINDLDNATAASANLLLSTVQNSGVSSDQNVQELPDQISTAIKSSNNSSLPEKEATEPRAESVTANSTQIDAKPRGEDDDDNVGASNFPKSSTRHKATEQKDRRAKRLTKFVRVYHDLSTIIDYQEDDNKAVTTIRFKSAQKQ